MLWLLSDDQRFPLQVTNPLNGQVYTLIPLLFLLAAPVSAVMIALFLTLAGDRRSGRTVAAGLGLAASAAYVLLFFPRIWPRIFQEQYLSLMVLHLALLAWAAVGLVALARRGDQGNRFAFLVKSLEAFVVAGLLAIVGGIFTGITFGLFNALGIEPPEAIMRLFFAGGAGLIAIVAVALVYDPAVAPIAQSFEDGLSKLVALLLRLLLPLTVAVLLIYVGFIPFNWREPFENREVLLIFNAMLFAVIALLMGVTPMHETDLGERAQTWLRRGVIAVRGARAAGQPLCAGCDPLSHRQWPPDPQPPAVHRLERDQHRDPGPVVDPSGQGGAGALAAGHAPHLRHRHGVVFDLGGGGPGGAALVVPRRSGPGGQPAAEDPADRFRPARSHPAEMPDQSAHQPAGSRPEALGKGYTDLRGRGLPLERRYSVGHLR